MIVRKSRAIWLTKTVDTAVSYLVHVVVYAVPACPADTGKVCLSVVKYDFMPFLLDIV